MKKTFLKSIILIPSLLLMFAIMATSCNESDDNRLNLGTSYLDLVTLESTSSQGSVFTFRKNDNSPEITLTTTQAFTSNPPKAGERLAIEYIPESGKRYESGPVRVNSIAKAYGPEYTTEKAPSVENSDPVALLGAWRTDQFLNIQISVTMMSKPTEFSFILDSETAGNEYPEFYLVFRKDFAESTVKYSIFGSYDLEKFWNSAKCKGVKIHCNEAMGANVITVHKSISTSPKPAE